MSTCRRVSDVSSRTKVRVFFSLLRNIKKLVIIIEEIVKKIK